MASGQGASETDSCPLCGEPLYAWIALPPGGRRGERRGAARRADERVLDRCESCGVALERDREVDLTAEWTAVCRPAEPRGAEDRDPEPRQPPGGDRRRGLGGDRALPRPADPHPGEPRAARRRQTATRSSASGARSRAGPRRGCGRRCSTGSPSTPTSPARCAPAGCTPRHRRAGALRRSTWSSPSSARRWWRSSRCRSSSGRRWPDRGGELVATAPPRAARLSAGQSARRQIRFASGRASARGACWPEIAPARFSSPGTTTRLPSLGALDRRPGDVLDRRPDEPRDPLLGAADPGDVGELGLHRARADAR